MEKDSEKRKAELEAILMENRVRATEAEEALNHHLNQLQRLGATLEDNVCGVLRKVLAQAQAREELYRITLDPEYL